MGFLLTFETSPTVACCSPGEIATTGLNADIAQIDDQELVMCGWTGTTYEQFTSPNWASVAAWVAAGGKLVAIGGRSGVGGMTAPQIADMNSFLSSIGSTLTLGSNHYCVIPFGGTCTDATNVTNTAVAICSGVEHLNASDSNSVSGGTWIAKFASGLTCPTGSGFFFLAGEYVGNGFVMLAGTPGAWCPVNQGCDLLRNLVFMEANALL